MDIGAPSIKNLLASFRDLTEDKARLIRKLCSIADDREALIRALEADCPETMRYAQSCYNDPFSSAMWRRTMVLHALDKILGTFGVEALGTVNMHKGPPYEYLNNGDTYGITLIYCRSEDRIRIGCWGAYAEGMRGSRQPMGY